ncbi:MAG TPA: ankyrin repeat domain-containing protein [Telluria sp.]|jgi:ankyrin repeat protein
MSKCFLAAVFAVMLSMAACRDRPAAPEVPLSTLHMAAQYGDAKATRALVAQGHSIDALDQFGRTPLAYAVMAHHMDVVKVLIALGANKETRTAQGYDLVMLSLYNEIDPSLDMLNYLVDLGMDVNNSTSDGDSALNIAISAQHEQAVERLIALGARANARSLAILDAQSNPSLVIERLVRKGKLAPGQLQ